MNGSAVPLGELMPAKKASLDPRKTPEQSFQLFSIPAFDSGHPAIVYGNEIGSSKQVVKVGDVLLSKIVPHIRRAWVVDSNSELPTIGSSEWIIFRSDRFEPRYLRHLLISDRFHQAFMQTVAGVGGSLLRARPSYVADIEVPLPPIEEQRRIAAVLDAADALRAKRRQAIAKLDTLTQAIFIDMFGDPMQSRDGEEHTSVGDTLRYLKYGPRFYNESYSDQGIPVVRITDLDEGGRLDFSAMPRYDVSPQDREKYRLAPGDLIFARSGATVGKVALMKPEDPECIAGAYFVQMRFRDEIEPEYARAVLTCKPVQSTIRKRSRQAAQQNFSGPGIRRLPMPMAPRRLQRQFATHVEQVRARLDTLDTGMTALDKLFGSLQQRAFRGEL